VCVGGGVSCSGCVGGANERVGERICVSDSGWYRGGVFHQEWRLSSYNNSIHDAFMCAT